MLERNIVFVKNWLKVNGHVANVLTGFVLNVTQKFRVYLKTIAIDEETNGGVQIVLKLNRLVLKVISNNIKILILFKNLLIKRNKQYKHVLKS